MSEQLKYLLKAEIAARSAHKLTQIAHEAAQKSYESLVEQEFAWDMWRNAVDAEFRALQEVDRARVAWQQWMKGSLR